MIKNESEFLEIIDSRLFVDNPKIQDDLYAFSAQNPKFIYFYLLWLIQEAYPTTFSFILLEPIILSIATNDEVLRCLEVFQYKPSSFVEKILDEGSSEQIERLGLVLKEVFHE